MAVSRYYEETKAALKTYPGFKLFLSVVYFTSLAVITLPEMRSHGLSSQCWEFIVGYWSATNLRLAEVLGLTVLLIAVFLSDSLRPLHQKQFGRYRQESVPTGWVTAAKVLGFLAFLFAVYVIPFLALHIPTLALNVGKLAWATSTLVPYFSLFQGEDSGGVIDDLSHMRFDGSYFDTAALAPLRSPVVEQIHVCLQYCEKGPGDPDTQRFIRNGQRGTPWGGVDDLFLRLANFLSVPPEHLTFHERTTNAIAFALQEIVADRRVRGLPPAKVLTTDIEYPGVVHDLLPEFVREGSIELLAPVQLKGLVLSGTNSESIQAVLKSACREHRSDILLIAHVHYATGYVVDIETLSRSFDADARPIIVVDGAQSVGNIEVTSRVFQDVEYYATGAHKWLLVPSHLGVLIRNRELLKSKHDFKTFETPNRPDASYPYVSRPFSVTISYDPYFGLSSMLKNELQIIRMENIADHNRRLADLFRNEVLALGYRPLVDENRGSIVSVSFAGNTEAIHRSLQVNGIKCNLMRIDHDGAVIPLIRFCFHFYHSKDDVFRLLDFLDAELVRGRSYGLA